jgi:hypothetical protein
MLWLFFKSVMTCEIVLGTSSFAVEVDGLASVIGTCVNLLFEFSIGLPPLTPARFPLQSVGYAFQAVPSLAAPWLKCIDGCTSLTAT